MSRRTCCIQLCFIIRDWFFSFKIEPICSICKRGLSHLNKCGSLLTWKKQTVSDRIIRSSRRQSASYFFRTTTSVAYSVFVFFRLPRTNEFRVFRSVSFGEDYLCSERWPSARFRRRHSPVPDTGIVGRLRLLSKVRTRLQPEYCD